MPLVPNCGSSNPQRPQVQRCRLSGPHMNTAEQSRAADAANSSGLVRSSLSVLLCWLYRWRFLRRVCLTAARRLEAGDLYSWTLRRVLKAYHGVDVGAYSYGECLIPGTWPAGVV